ncbi:MAG: ABC transporter permease [Microthrixaceae bacterium]
MTAPAKVWEYRTLIANLAQRDLRSRYKKSFLGWLWSMINPAMTLTIYAVVFGVFLKGEAPKLSNGEGGNFALYLFAGLVVWNAFNGGINVAIQSFLAAGGLLTRTYFPPEVPVVAGGLTVLTQTALETVILFAFMIALGNVGWTTVLALPIMAMVSVFAFGIGLVVSLLNIRYRDVGYLTALGLQILFYATPIVYREDLLVDHPGFHTALKLNPLTHFVGGLRDSMYLLKAPTLQNWGAMVLATALALALGWYLFGRMAPRYIEEI